MACGFIPFIFNNRPAVSFPRVKTFFEKLRKAEGASLPVGAAGFCWGGKHTVLLAAGHEIDGKALIDAGFTGHPSLLSFPTDVEKMVIPVSFAIGSEDHAMSKERVEQIRRIVEGKPEGQKGEVTIYDGAAHGFCVRADVKNPDVSKQAGEAENQCINWFNLRFKL